MINRIIRNLSTIKNNKVLMITFDDGPDEKNTPKLLNELAKRDAKVTFFIIGEKANNSPNLVRRAFSEGHTIANHTYSHKDLTKLSTDEIKDEINSTNLLLQDLLGIKNQYVRVPFGNINDNVINISDMTFIFWNIDLEDWKHQNPIYVKEKIMSSAKNGAIILMHDLYSSTVEGILDAIDELLEQGYTLISLEEAEQLGYINPKGNRKFDLLNIN